MRKFDNKELKRVLRHCIEAKLLTDCKQCPLSEEDHCVVELITQAFERIEALEALNEGDKDE